MFDYVAAVEKRDATAADGVRTSDTRYFADPSIATVALGLEPSDNTTIMKEPSFKMVLTAAGGYAYQRKDGVLVVPAGCLRD